MAHPPTTPAPWYIAGPLGPGERVRIADIIIGEVLPDSALRTSISGPFESPALCWKQR